MHNNSQKEVRVDVTAVKAIYRLLEELKACERKEQAQLPTQTLHPNISQILQ